MISKKLKYIFALSILLFVVHGVEEYLTGFYNLDQWDEWIFGLLPFVSTHQVMFATFQVMLWLLLLVALVLLINERTRFFALSLVGIMYLFELHHPIKALIEGGYYPGLITSLAFPIIAYFFWMEWFKNYKPIKQK